MDIKARYTKLILQFKFPAGTSRGILNQKDTYFLILEKEGKTGIGECSTIPGLSFDYSDDYENNIKEICSLINESKEVPEEFLKKLPSVKFGFETALLDLENGGRRILFPSGFTDGGMPIPINGLIWMGNEQFMIRQIDEKLNAGFTCLKMKVGAINFEKELSVLKYIRKNFNEYDLSIRLDANGAFSTDEALEKLTRLSEYSIHSIEQPIKPKQYEHMERLCAISPIPIAFDEELIGIHSVHDKTALLREITPAFIVLKPSVLGGLQETMEWIDVARKLNISWWVTSALESNIGLNAIAQWVNTLKPKLVQGLGTGSLYKNNIPSPLHVDKACLFYDLEKSWKVDEIVQH